MPNNEIEKDILSSIENGGNSPKDIHSKMKQKKHNPDLIREAIHHLREKVKSLLIVH